MKKTFLVVLTLCIIALSCKKDDPDPVAPTNTSYANMNTGTRWIYNNRGIDPVSGDTTNTTDTATVANGDTTVAQGTSQERTYKIVNHTSGGNTYLNVSGTDYYQFRDVADLGVQVQALYLKDNIDQNASWVQNETVTIPNFPFPITLTFTSTVTEKNISRTVNGTTYNNVIGVDTDLSIPGVTVSSNIKNYYAPNIGLIEGLYDIDAPGVVTFYTQTFLVRADVQ